MAYIVVFLGGGLGAALRSRGPRDGGRRCCQGGAKNCTEQSRESKHSMTPLGRAAE